MFLMKYRTAQIAGVRHFSVPLFQLTSLRSQKDPGQGSLKAKYNYYFHIKTFERKLGICQKTKTNKKIN